MSRQCIWCLVSFFFSNQALLFASFIFILFFLMAIAIAIELTRAPPSGHGQLRDSIHIILRNDTLTVFASFLLFFSLINRLSL
jgi:hypothetical protein